MGAAQQAANFFHKLYEVTPEDFRVSGELGFLHLHHLGNTKRAKEYFHTSLKLNPEL